ncbi:MAG: hypothetical protein ACNA8J_08720 [Gammaproteobacteria bacterium]
MKRMVIALALLSVSLPATANWEFRENIDPMTDEDKSIAATFSGRNEFVVVRCSGDSDYEIFLGVGTYIGSTRGRGSPVVYRADAEPPVEGGTWSTSTDGTAVFVPRASKGAFLDILKTASKVTIQVTDFRGSRHHAVFDLSGASDAISKLHCMK